ncbi:MAG: peptidoglycan-binding protein LysM [Saprospiraceae bacterium]|nr:peptidoglycan-binding protein LysM [Saprospiraceae bacterium]
MGLFSFLKKAGSKLFSKNEKEREGTTTDGIAEEVEQAQKLTLLRGVVESLNFDIENFELDLNEDTVIVYGQMTSQANKEKVILALGNVAGIASVDDRITVEAAEPEAQFYEVKKGDYLSKIAKELYGDPMKYPIIFEANKPMLKDPDLIYPGQMLRIPALEA